MIPRTGCWNLAITQTATGKWISARAVMSGLCKCQTRRHAGVIPGELPLAQLSGFAILSARLRTLVKQRSVRRMLTDRETGRSRGFAFVEMANAEEGEKAIAGLNGTQLGGRTINVNEARPKAERAGGGGGGRDRGRGR